MEFHAQREALLQEIQLLGGVIEKKNTMPILANVLVRAENNLLSIKATDLEVGIITECPAQVLQAGEFTINGKRLQEILSTLSEAQVAFSLNENSMLDIVCGSASFSIDIMPAKDYPDIPVYDFVGSLALNNALFQDCLDRVFFSISGDPHKFALNGALFEIAGNQMTMASTDGHRLSRVRGELTQDVEDISVIVPKKSLGEIKKLLQAEGESELFLLGSFDTRLFVKVGKRVLFSRLIDGKFPDFEKAIPLNNDNEFILDRSALLEIMRRKLVLSTDKSKLVRLSFQPGQLHVVLRNPERGESVDTLPIPYQGEAFDIGFNIQYLHEFLRAMSAPRIKLLLKDGNAQGLFRLADDEGIDYCHVLMPMRVV